MHPFVTELGQNPDVFVTKLGLGTYPTFLLSCRKAGSFPKPAIDKK